MARYTGPRTRKSRRLGQILDDNKAKYYDRRPYPPGEHGRRRGRRSSDSDYLHQLKEKQKMRQIYGILERQFRRYYEEAARVKGITGDNLLQILECRLDNVVYRSGLARTRPQARQLVNHGHFQVNGHKVDIPSYRVRAGDLVTVKEKSRNIIVIRHAADTSGDRRIPEWLEVVLDERQIRVIDVPNRAQIDTAVREQLVVELYSR
ncbi:MAG: 30S ribosomal protein S4 [Acidimicrobiia bacterium]|nr:30S ribosomal protein S4 [bacterium]MXX64438.1 30S ribosomal protein S4 [Acidimicrobiia bacterium]MCY3579225.1 30S ribosomal protein S4 [bacterium]MCY3653342.1 30S ribosomal protein S4 [bacterium]MDE0644116.1 30S ribosomal protein S4 [bacterium]